MYQKHNLNGISLHNKELCLTFDDGPGPQTLEIARFLHQQNIKAAFFVVGKFAVHQLDTLMELQKMGHLICNHTYEHPDLPYYCSIDGDAQDQILRTDVAIRQYINDQTIFFRAPYGKWSGEVAKELNANLLTAFDHVGPVHWDIPGIDCHYWDIGKTVEEAKLEYISNIEKTGKGIVVFHDEIADMEILQSKNKTAELIKLLIPELIQLGYTFKAMDQIPELEVEKQKTKQLILLSGKGKNFVAFRNELSVQKGSSKHGGILFEIRFLAKGKVLLKTPDDYYLSKYPEMPGKVMLSSKPDFSSEFDFVQVRYNRFILRSFSGRYLNLDKSGHLMATAQHMRQAEVFKYSLPNFNEVKRLTFRKKMELMKKRILFIKSKLMQS